MSAKPPQITYVYVDGFNLYYGALRGTRYKWLDLAKFCQSLLPSDNIGAIKDFTAKVSGRRGDPGEPIRQQLYFRALGTLPKVSIIYGQFLTHSIPLPVSGSNPTKWAKVDKTEEKGSDVNLTAHLLHDGFKKLYDTAVIISNDSDALPSLSLPPLFLPAARRSHALSDPADFDLTGMLFSLG